MKLFLTITSILIFLTINPATYAGDSDKVLWEIYLPWGNGPDKAARITGVADRYSGDTRTLHKLGKSQVAVYAFIKAGRLMISIGPKYIKARKFYPIMYGTSVRMSDWYKLDGLRGSKYYNTVVRGKLIEDSHNDVKIVIRRN